MAQNGQIIDHTCASVPLISALREKVAAKAGEILTVRKASAPSAAIWAALVKIALVICFFHSRIVTGYEARIGIDRGSWRKGVGSELHLSSRQLEAAVTRGQFRK